MDETKIKKQYIAIASRIKQARLMAKMSQQDLGEKMYKTGAAIGYIERGERGLNVEDLIRFSKVLKVPISYFFGFDESRETKIYDTLDRLQTHVKRLTKTFIDESENIHRLVEKVPKREDLKLLCESSLDPIILVSKSAQILYCSSAIHELLGIHPSSIIGHSCDTIIIRQDYEKCQNFIQEVFEYKKVKNFEANLKHISGKVVNVEINAKLVQKDGQSIVHAVMRDVTKRTLVEKKLIETESKLRDLVNNVNQGILSINKKGEITDFNPAALEILNMSESVLKDASFDVLDWKFVDRYSKENSQGDQHPIKYCLQQNCIQKNLLIKAKIKTKLSKIIYLLLNVVPRLDNRQNLAKLYITFSDVTQLRITRNQLRISERKYSAILKQSIDGIFVTNDHGIIVDWNKTLVDMLKLPEKKAIGMTIEELIDKFRSQVKWKKMHFDLKKVYQLLSSNKKINKQYECLIALILDSKRVKTFHTLVFPIYTKQHNYLAYILREIKD